jgi:L-fucose isomerase-like protein
MSFTYRVIASPLHEALDAVLAPFVSALASIGGSPGTQNESLVFVATGGTEQLILDWWIERNDRPVFMVAHPGHNSLPASLEALARLHQLGARGRILYLRGEHDEGGLAAIRDAVEGLDVHSALRHARIGRAGLPSDWLVASSPDPAVVEATWGPTVVDISLDDVYTDFSDVTPGGAAGLAADLHEHAHGVEGPSEDQIRDAARLTVALKGIAEKNTLTAVSVRCFDLLGDIATAGCFALSELNDNGIVAGCEGDIVSTIGILWARELTGETPWMANPAQVDVDANTVLLAHCTVPRSLVDSYSLRSHFESGTSVGIQGTIPPGAVTLLRIGGSRMERIWLAEGDIRERQPIEGLCRTQVDVQLSRGSVADLLEDPLGNHVVIVRGHHADSLRSWWKVFIA